MEHKPLVELPRCRRRTALRTLSKFREDEFRLPYRNFFYLLGRLEEILFRLREIIIIKVPGSVVASQLLTMAKTDVPERANAP